MQRLAGDRLKRQWEEWQEEQAKRQKKQDTLTKELRRRQENINDDLLKRLKAIPPVLQLYQSQLDTLWETRRNDATNLLKTAQNIYDALTAPIDEQLALLREQQEHKAKGKSRSR